MKHYLLLRRFAVFALGSSAYPRYCAFGRAIDAKLKSLGADRLCTCGEGDDMGSQDEAFHEWCTKLFKVYFLSVYTSYLCELY